MSEKEQLQVEAIKNGTVIDHIPAGQALNILKHFHILDNNDRITVGFNLPSKANGHKDLIKVENVRITEEQANQLSIFAPNATVNIIEDYKVVTKRKIELPDSVTAVFKCPNSNCISNVERTAVTNFKVINKNGKIQLKCRFCEKVFNKDIVTDNI
ncbi:aspartate carbamoyltransferase regulatory subunit [Ruminobacter sp.]|jgi:aspartate carbamoyltransferase regulatory subunit|uniref:aspartate carbamoyltransferase regulatory subunit n=1 Tax=Ruminobacter sp. TaxID=2774296 RepID=UPI001B764F96|nr:aspartate carbamoyltransferase regulatory subunit [Ruminobacter sp.]MBP3749833.1 aspartate carbamoyltransferase regulatory subunit [Ruminobacter sp.]